MIKRFKAHVIVQPEFCDFNSNEWKRYNVYTVNIDTDNIVVAFDTAIATRPSGQLGVAEPCGYYRFVQMSSGQWLVLLSDKETDLYFDFDMMLEKQKLLEKLAGENNTLL